MLQSLHARCDLMQIRARPRFNYRTPTACRIIALFGVGYVENLTRQYSGRAVDLYKAMAQEAKQSYDS